MKNNTYPLKKDFLGIGLVIDYEKLMKLQTVDENIREEINSTSKSDTKNKGYTKKLNRKILKR